MLIFWEEFCHNNREQSWFSIYCLSLGKLFDCSVPQLLLIYGMGPMVAPTQKGPNSRPESQLHQLTGLT